MPTTMVAASNTRVATKPSARPSCWRLITENTATAEPTAVRALTRSSRQASMIWRSAPGPTM